MGHFNIAPSEYWKMTPNEVQILIESKRPKKIGSLHEDDFYYLAEKRKELEAQGIKVW